jgi:hypothetical protein
LLRYIDEKLFQSFVVEIAEMHIEKLHAA